MGFGTYIAAALQYRNRNQELKNIHAFVNIQIMLYSALDLFRAILNLYQTYLNLNPSILIGINLDKVSDIYQKLEQFVVANPFPNLLQEDMFAYIDNDFNIPIDFKFTLELTNKVIEEPLSMSKGDIANIKKMANTISQIDFLIIPFKCSYIQTCLNRISELGIFAGVVRSRYSPNLISIPDQLNQNRLRALVNYLKDKNKTIVTNETKSEVDNAIIFLEKFLLSKNNNDLKNSILYILKSCIKHSDLIKTNAGEFKLNVNSTLTINSLSTYSVEFI